MASEPPIMCGACHDDDVFMVRSRVWLADGTITVIDSACCRDCGSITTMTRQSEITIVRMLDFYPDVE